MFIRQKISVFFVPLLVFSLNSAAQCFAADKDLVAYWSFDETKGEVVKDSSENCEEADVIDGEWVKGRVGNALRFNGESSYVQCYVSPALEIIEGLTIEAWIYPENIARGRQGIIYKHYNNEYEVIIEPDAKISFYHGDGQYEEIEEPVIAIPENAWTHIAVTRNMDSGKIGFYVNGELKGEADFIKIPQASAGPVSIGWRTGTTFYFQGIIDEVKIYSRALTEKEIKEEAGRVK